MNLGELTGVFLAAFTAILAFGSVVLLYHALRENNKHVRNVIEQLTTWNIRSRAETNRAEVTEAEVKTEREFAQPAADGTIPYAHPRSVTPDDRPLIIRNDSAGLTEEARQPISIDRPARDAAFTGLVAAIGMTAPDRGLMQSLEDFARRTTDGNGLAFSVAEDEFVFAFPLRAHGVSRRTNDLAESLWNLQLRAPSQSAALLAWSFVEVNGEPLSEAIVAACERMREARRVRYDLSSRGAVREPVVYISLLGRLLALRASNIARSNDHPEITVLLDDNSSSAPAAE